MASNVLPIAVVVLKQRLTIIGLAVAMLPLVAVASRDTQGLTFVVRGANLDGVVRHLADLDTVGIREQIVSIPFRDGSIRGRAYVPERGSRQTVLLVSGLHPDGIDEPRLKAFSRAWAEAGITVVTPEIPELSRFEVTPDATDHIEGAAVWLATQSGFAPTGHIGLAGISFSGGLAVVAAGRPTLRARLLYVFSLGGHDDLPRTVEYLCTGVERGHFGALQPPPHDYGAVVVLLNVAERLVPPDQLDVVRDAARRFLWASYLDRFDKPAAEREFAALKDLAHTLPEPGAMLLRYMNDRDVAHLGPKLLPYAMSYANRPGLSPASSPAPEVPVFLLHGRGDNVIPAAESQYLAERLASQADVRLLITDLISHVDTDRPAHFIDVVQLARFWGDLLDQ
jgi:dienelactone hydrolase